MGLGESVAALLPEIGRDGRAAVMPDDGGGSEKELASRVLQTPADVHVVTCGGEFLAKPADGLEGGGIDDKDYATFSYDRDTRP
jgi:hypothetical protein